MRIDIHSNLRNAQTLDISRAIVYDRNGTPFAVIMDIGHDVAVIRATDDNFIDALRMLGVDRTVQVQKIDTSLFRPG